MDIYHHVAHALPVHYQAEAKAMFNGQHSQEMTHIILQLAVTLILHSQDLHHDQSAQWQSCPHKLSF